MSKDPFEEMLEDAKQMVAAMDFDPIAVHRAKKQTACRWMIYFCFHNRMLVKQSKGLVFALGNLNLIKAGDVSYAIKGKCTREINSWRRTNAFKEAKRTQDLMFFYSYSKNRFIRCLDLLDTFRTIAETQHKELGFTGYPIVKDLNGQEFSYNDARYKISDDIAWIFYSQPSQVKATLDLIDIARSSLFDEMYEMIFALDACIAGFEHIEEVFTLGEGV